MRLQRSTYVDVPHTLADIITSRSGTSLCGTFASELDPRVLLEVPDALGEEPGSNEVQKACRDDEEDLERCPVATLVDEVADEGTSSETTDHSQRE